MGDRHDIDALLIGSLYGELSSADEARLKAHLESHPADRSALDGLVRTRDAVRASRIFEVQLEPPQSVSALLLQEAVRRAPRKAAHDEAVREGWFVRLRRSFLFSPAFAAAAMLVVVVGVAGTMYSRKGDHVSRPEAAAPAVSGEGAREQAPAFATPPAAAPAAGFDGAAAGSAAVAQEPAADRADFKIGSQQAGGTRRDRAADSDAYRVDLAEGDVARPAEEQKAEKAKLRSTAPALEVTTPQRAPKDLDEPRLAKATKGFAGPKTEDQPAGGAPAPAPAADPPATPAPAPKRGVAPPPPKPAPAVRAPDVAPAAPAAPSIAQESAKAPGGATGTGTAVTGGAGGAYGSYDGGKGAVDPDLAWAKAQHSRLVGQVRAGRCTDAAGTAVALSNRAPGYYQQNVENDRQVKSCLAYINAERERATERAQRAKATTRRGGEEAPAPAQATKRPPAKAAPSKAAPTKAAPAQADEAPAQTKSR